jgi:hypothetical protein
MDYITLAKAVLTSYNVFEPEINFIRHNENMTFKITDKELNKCFLLRIHKPVAEGLYGIQHTFEGLDSEIKILEQLSLNSKLKVQKPVANANGEYVTDSSELVGSTCYSTLLEWIDGEIFTGKEQNVVRSHLKLEKVWHNFTNACIILGRIKN